MRSDRSRDARQHSKARFAFSDLMQKVTVVPARSFWSIVLATMLLADKALAAQAPTADRQDEAKDEAKDNADTLAASAQPPDHQVATDAGADALDGVLAPPTDAAFAFDVEPLSDQALATMVQKWLGAGASHALYSEEVAASTLGQAASARTSLGASSVQDVRQSFRELFNEELSFAGKSPITDADDGAVKTAVSSPGLDFNPVYLLGLLGLGAAGGGGGAAGAAGGSSVVALLQGGTVVKGYLQGALVWRDGNSNNKFDGTWTDANHDGMVQSGEITGAGQDAFAITDASGKYTGLGGSGTIHVFGGKDIYGTGLAFAGVLSAPDAATVITPLTTLVASIAQPGETAQAAALRLASLLQLGNSVSASDLLSVDPISAALASTSSAAASKALALYAKSSEVANLLIAATAAVQKAGGNAISQLDASSLVVKSIAQALNNPDHGVSFTSTAFVGDILGKVQANLIVQLPAAAALADTTDLVLAITNVNSAFSDVALGAQTVKDALTALVQTEYVVQNDVASAVSAGTLSSQTSLLDTSLLQLRLDQVSSVVGSIAAPTAGQVSPPGAPTIVGLSMGSSPIAYINGGFITSHGGAGQGTVQINVTLPGDAKAGELVRLYLDGTQIFESGAAQAAHVLSSSEISAGAVVLSVGTSVLQALNTAAGPVKLSASINVAASGTAAEIVGVSSKVLPIVVDLLAQAPTLSLSAASDTGILSNDGVTNADAPIVLVKNTEAGARINYTVSLDVGSGSVALGSWSDTAGSDTQVDLGQKLKDLGKLAAGATPTSGAYTIVATQTDLAGNTSLPTTYQLVVDKAIDTFSLAATAATNTGASSTLSTGGATKDNTLSFSGQAFDANGIVSVEIYDGANKLGNAAISGNAWTYTTSSLADATHRFTAKATDVAGNVVTSAVFAATVDVTAPVASFGATLLTNTGAQQSIVSGQSTKDNTIGLSVVANDVTSGVQSVEIFDGATSLGQATLSSGAWKLTTGALSETAHSFTAVVTDNAGNTTTTSAVTATVDTTAPTIASFGVAANTGALVSGALTNDNMLDISVSASDAGGVTSVQVFDGATSLGQAILDQGHWKLTTAALADGSHSLKVSVTDVVGNVKDSSAFGVQVDATAPLAAIDSASATNGGVTKNGQLVLNVTASDANGIALVEIYDGTNKLGNAALSGNAWTYTASSLVDGAHRFTANVTDGAGNVKTTSVFAVTVDAAAPAASMVTNTGTGQTLVSGESTKDSTIALSVVASDLTSGVQSVEIFDGATSLGLATLSSGAWKLTTGALSDSGHSFTAVVTDNAGNTTTTSAVAVTVDATAPTIASFGVVANTGALGSGALTNDNKLDISVSASDASGVKSVQVFDGTTALGPAILDQGQWKLTTAALTDGSHSLKVSVTDEVGNVKDSSAFVVQVDTLAPAISINSLANAGLINSTSLVLGGTVSDAVGIQKVEVYDGVSLVGAARVNSDGTWSMTALGLPAGVHNFKAVATDLAGNTTDSATVAATVDTTAPLAGLDAAILTNTGANGSVAWGGITKDTTLGITVNASDESTGVQSVQIYDGISLLGSASKNQNAWSLTTAQLSDGEHSISAHVTDGAGNTKITSVQTITVDSAPPVLSLDPIGSHANFLNISDLSGTLVISGSALQAEDGQAVTLIFSQTGNPDVLTKLVGVSGESFVLELSSDEKALLSTGDYTLTAQVADLAGNSANTAASFRVDITPPLAPTLSLSNDTNLLDGVTKVGTLSVAGLEQNASWRYSLDSGQSWSQLAAVGSATTGTLTLPEGSYTSGQIVVEVQDAAGNPTQQAYASAVVVDSTSPTVSRIDATGDATYSRGQDIYLVLQANENLYVSTSLDASGNTVGPRLKLALESATARYATYVSGSGTSALMFKYTVANGDLDTNGISITSLQLPSGANGVASAISDLAGNAVDTAALVSSLSTVANSHLTGVNVNGAVVGTAADGYLVNVVIFADTNNSNSIDSGEAVGGSVGPGVFSIPGGTGHLIMRGGSDISTGQPFTVQYEAPEGYLVVNPITTLISRVQSLGGAKYYQLDENDNPVYLKDSADASKLATSASTAVLIDATQQVFTEFKTATSAAETLVKSALGIQSSVKLDFTSYDPFAEASKAVASYASTVDPTTAKLQAVAYQKSAAMLATLADVGSSVLAFVDTSGKTDTTAASIDLVNAVADQLRLHSGWTLADILTSSANLKTVILEAAGVEGLHLSDTQVTGIALVLSKANGIISNESTAAISDNTDGRDAAKDALSLLRQIVAVQSVVQGDSIVKQLETFISANPTDTAALSTLLGQDSVAGSLGYQAANTIVGPIVPSRFSMASDATASGSQMPSVYEGNADGSDRVITFTITRGGGLDGTVVLNYQLSGSATLTADRFVTADKLLPHGQVTFGPDETSKTISVRIANNAVINPNELLTLAISDAYGNSQFTDALGNLTTSSSTQLLLLDDDPNTPVLSGPTTQDLVAGKLGSIPGLSVNYYDANAGLQVNLTATHGTLSGPNLESLGNGVYRLFKLAADNTTHLYDLTKAEVNQQLTLLSFTGDKSTVSGGVHLDVMPVGRAVIGSTDVAVTLHNASEITVPTSTVQAVTAATATALAPVQVSDIDSPNLTVTLASVGGILQVASTAGVFATSTGSTVVLSGSGSALNIALANMSFVATAGRTSASVQVTVSDGDKLTPDPVQSFSLKVNPAAPTAALPGQLLATVGIDAALTGISVKDVDSTSVTATLTADAGTFKLGAVVSGVSATLSTDAKSIVLTGTPDSITKTLAGATYLAASIADQPKLTLNVVDSGGLTSQLSTLTVSVIDNQPPAAGGDVTATVPTSASNNLVVEDTATVVRITPATLSNPDGPAPTQIRILSVDGASLKGADASAIVLGANGTVLTLNANGGTALDLSLTPDLNRNTPVKISYAVVDPVLGTLNSAASVATVNIQAVNDASVLSAPTSTVTFTEKAGAVAVFASVGLSDVDSTTLSAAKVSITGGLDAANDVLSATLGTSGLKQSYDASAGVLTITGTASLDAYKAVLQSVTFNNSNKALPSGDARTVQLQVTDSSGDANTASSLAISRSLVTVGVNDAPVIGLSTTNPTFVESSTADKLGSLVLVSPQITLSDPDGAADLTRGASVSFSSGYRVGQDVLKVDASVATAKGITSSFDAVTGTLTLSGNATNADYQALLRTLTYQNSSAAPATDARQLQISVSDQAGAKGVQALTVSITPFNDAPVLDLNGPNDASATTTSTAVGGSLPVASAIAPVATLADSDTTTATSLQVAIASPGTTDGLWLSDGAKAAVLAAGLKLYAADGTTAWAAGSSALLVKSASAGLVSLAVYQTVLDGVLFKSADTSGTRTVNVTLSNDGSPTQLLNTVSASVTVSLVNTPFAQVQTSGWDGSSSTLILAGTPSASSFVADLTSSLVATDSQRMSVSNLFKATQIDASLVTGVSSTTLTGTTGDNIIMGSAVNDLIMGAGGNDVLVGGDGSDTFRLTLDQLGSAGLKIFGGQATFVPASGGTAASWVAGADTATDTLEIFGAAGTLSADSWAKLVGIDKVVVKGTGDFTLNAAGANQTLVGGSGNDTLIAGGASDTLTGGGGFNTFAFASSTVGTTAPTYDTITDITVGDKIQLPTGLTWAGVKPASFSAQLNDAWFDSSSNTLFFKDGLGVHGIVLPASVSAKGWADSTSTGALQLTVQPASVGAPVLAAASDTGVSNSDGITQVTTPTVSVSLAGSGAVVDSQVRLYTSTNQLVAAKVLTSADIAAGQVQLTVGTTVTGLTLGLAALPIGATTLVARQWVAGPSGTSFVSADAVSNQAITVDTVAPVVSITSLGGADKVVSTISGDNVLTGTAEAGSVSLYSGGALLGTTAAVAGNWTYTLTDANITALQQGSGKSITANQTDTAGNVGVSAAYSFAIDTVAPTVSIAREVSNNLTNTQAKAGDTVTVTFTSTDPVTAVTIGGKTATVTSSGNNYTASYVVKSGDNGATGVSITAVDAAGNVTTQTLASAVTMDTLAPSVAIASETSSNSTNTLAKAGDTVTVVFTSTDPVTTATIGGKSATVTGSGGNYTASYVVKSGDSGATDVSITATDAAGNASTKTLASAVTLDTAAPVVTIAALGGSDKVVSGLTGDNVLNGTAEANRAVSVYSGLTLLGTAAADASGNWTYALSGANITTLQQGTAKSITASQTDAAGNVGTSTAYAFAVDTVAPTATLLAVPAAAVYGPSSVLTFDVAYSEAVLLSSGAALNLLLTLADQSQVTVQATLAQTQLVPSVGGAYTQAQFTYTTGKVLAATAVTLLGPSSQPSDLAGNVMAAVPSVVLAGVSFNPANSAPVWGASTVVGGVTETSQLTDTLTSTGALSFVDQDISDVHLISSAPLSGVQNLGALTLTKTADTTGTGLGGQVGWSYAVSSAALQSLAASQTRVDKFTVTLDDQHGGVITKEVDVTLTGINTPAVVSGDKVKSVTEGGTAAAISTSGQLTASDVDSAAGFVAQTDVLGSKGYGKFSMDANGAWTYTANSAHSEFVGAQVYTDSITVSTVDGTTQVLTVSITGVNNVPVVNPITSPQTIVDTAGVDAYANLTGNVMASDAEGQTLSYAITSGQAAVQSLVGAYGTLTVNASSGAYSYVVNAQAVNALAAGATPNDSFAIQVSDGHGGLTTQNLVLNVTGANDNPVINASTSVAQAALTEAGNANNGAVLTGVVSSSGQLQSSDAEGAALSWAIASAPQTVYGAMTIDNAGRWTYTLNNSLNSTQQLVQGQVVTQNFVARVSDGAGGSADQTLVVTITGTNDAPVLKVYDSYPSPVFENGTGFVVANKASAAQTVGSDVDGTLTYVVTQWTQVGSTTSYTRNGNFGAATLDTSTGIVGYVFNDTLAESQALAAGKVDADQFFVSVTDGLAVTTKAVSFAVQGADDALHWNAATAPAVTLYHLGANRAVVRIENAATDGDSLLNYSSTLTNGSASASASLHSVGGALVGVVDLSALNSGGNYTLSLLAGSNNNSGDTGSISIAGNSVASLSAATVVSDLATGGVGNDYVQGSQLRTGEGYTPTFLGGAGNDVFEGLVGGMAFAGGIGSDSAIMRASDIQLSDSYVAQDGSLGLHYSISMVPIAKAQEQADYFNLSQGFVDALTSSSPYSGSQSALLAIDTSNGKAYTDAETLLVANSASSTDTSASGVKDVFALGADASNGNRLQLHLSDTGVRLVAGGLSDDIMGGSGNDVIVGGGNGNGVLIAGQGMAADIISGGAGNDVLAGGAKTSSHDLSYLDGGQGDDVLVAVSGTVYATGGTGRDVFALFSESDSVSLVIKDFDASNDRIDLSALTSLKGLVTADSAASLDQVQVLKDLLSSAVTDANGDMHIKLDAYLSPAAQASGLHAEIKIEAAGAVNGHISSQNFIFAEQAWSPYHWHDNLNPLV